MKIKASAFEFAVPPWASLPDFFQYCANFNDEPADGDLPQGRDPQRFLRIAPARRVAHGLNTYVRDRLTYYQLLRERRIPREIKRVESRNVMEFNFFFIRHDTGRGLLTQYRGCKTSIETFGIILKRRFRDFKQDLQAAQTPFGVTLKGNAAFRRLSRSEPWDARLRRMRKALALQITYKVLRPQEKPFRPHYWSQETRIIGFKPEAPIGRVASAITRFLRGESYERASIKAINPDDYEETIRVGPNAEVVGQWDYDDLVDEIDIDSFQESRVMRAILEYANHPILTVRAR